jgi:hypothetical protein|tara:strand:+ start:1376 stop:2029 length:654 start_codon:yes stop_codon:yes gene_type:complete
MHKTEFPMLTKETNVKLETLKLELEDTFTKRQIYRTETEMRLSVLNDFNHPTPAAKYWQAVREQSAMFENLVSLSFEHRKNEIKLLKAEKDIKEGKDEFVRMEAEVERDQCLWRRVQIKQDGGDRARELEEWSKIKKELDDGSFDTKSPNTHQVESLPIKFQRQLDVMTPNTPASEAQNIIGLYETAKRHINNKEFEKLNKKVDLVLLGEETKMIKI